MSFAGTVINGMIILDADKRLPDGVRVEVIVEGTIDASLEKKPTLLGLLKIAGTLDDLPADFAVEHDHYLHGTPKRFSKEN